MEMEYEHSLLKEGYTLIGGIDEAGRGPLAGPVIAACCILPKDQFFPSLNDSKKLTPKKREEIFDLLKNTPGVQYGIGVASPKEIDLLNILQATFLAMQRAVSELPFNPDYLLIDGNQSPPFSIPRKMLVGGDGIVPSIAAASIFAKVTRDRIMEELDQIWPNYGFKKHKGYGTKLHRDAIEKWGPCQEHRMTFAPISRSF